ncbi:hypothetical protein [Nocardioides furvisabuli]|nr:hypothetical protein [Nocardioides furvisabuli]
MSTRVSRRHGIVVPIVVPIVVLAGLLAPPQVMASAQAASVTSDVSAVPDNIPGVLELECPGAGVCIGTSDTDEGLDRFVGSTGEGRVWTVDPVPGSTGTDTYVLGVACASVSFCYAWGGTDRPAVWWTTTPGRGGWQVTVLPDGAAGVGAMTCAAAGACVAATTIGSDVATSTGTVWSTPGIGTGSWTARPLDLAYRVSGIECPSATTCVAWGDSASFPGHFQTDPTLWTTADALGGAWTRVLPTATGSGYSYTIKKVDCPAVTLCVANGVSGWSSGATSFLYSGYFASAAPTSPDAGTWVWHEGEGSRFEPGPLACLSVAVCLSWDGMRTMGSAPDPTDWEPPTPLDLPVEHELRLRAFDCFAADHCYAWGRDSGQATLGPLMRTRLWRGSVLGGAWTVSPLPDVPGHEGRIPQAQVSCNSASCTAVGRLADPEVSWDSLGPLVWVAATGGPWRLTAASRAVFPDLADDPSRVRSRVSLTVTSVAGRPRRLEGRVRASDGCARGRTVSVIGKGGAAVARVTSRAAGRYSIRLKPRVRARLGVRTHVVVAKKQRAAMTCLRAQSRAVRVR